MIKETIRTNGSIIVKDRKTFNAKTENEFNLLGNHIIIEEKEDKYTITINNTHFPPEGREDKDLKMVSKVAEIDFVGDYYRTEINTNKPSIVTFTGKNDELLKLSFKIKKSRRLNNG